MSIEKAMKSVGSWNGDLEPDIISFNQFLADLLVKKRDLMRNHFQVFHDMIFHSFGEGVDEYPDDPESIGFKKYNTNKLFVDGKNHPFYADRPFAQRIAKLAKSFVNGAQQNKI